MFIVCPAEPDTGMSTVQVDLGMDIYWYEFMIEVRALGGGTHVTSPRWSCSAWLTRTAGDILGAVTGLSRLMQTFLILDILDGVAAVLVLLGLNSSTVQMRKVCSQYRAPRGLCGTTPSIFWPPPLDAPAPEEGYSFAEWPSFRDPKLLVSAQGHVLALSCSVFLTLQKKYMLEWCIGV